MKINDNSATLVRKIGAFLLVAGGILFLFAYMRFTDLPNYARIASMLPALFGVPMLMIDNYRQGRAALSSRQRGQAIGLAILPFMALVAVIWWYLTDPAAKA